jgi:hypothetical protein
VRGLKFRSISPLKPSVRDSVPKSTIKTLFRKVIQGFGLARHIGTFEGVSCFSSKLGELKNRAAVVLPGIGIFVHPDEVANISLLRHEFGHILQARKWGKRFFYRYIAWQSIISARRSSHDPTFVHQHTWTEWTANRLAYYFFKRPDDWDMKSYPIHPPLEQREGSDWPEFLRFEKPVALVRHHNA